MQAIFQIWKYYGLDESPDTAVLGITPNFMAQYDRPSIYWLVADWAFMGPENAPYLNLAGLTI